MSRWKIYDKNGKERAVQWSADVSENVGENVGEYAEPQLEYHGTWMGECFVTLTVKCAVPVDFHIGDYIIYRGEKFVINYDPTVIKRARKGTYGEGFTYDSIKFNALHNELTEVMFLDYVLGDNGLHYTSLPVFPFFAATIDDFCDRLQANTNRYCEKNGIAPDDRWLFLTPTLDRTTQRALSCDMSSAEAMRRWNEAYGSGTSTDEIKTDVSVSISNQTVWNAMAMIKNSFGLNFINRGRSVIIGSAGLPTNHIFEYGKGNGLYEIERVADSEQQIVTKMYAYGNETNLPVRYYANIGVRCYARPTRMTFGSLTYYFLDMAWNEKLYCIEDKYADIDGYRVVVSNNNGQNTTAYVADPSSLSGISEGASLDDLTVIVFANSDFEVPLNGQELNFDSGINKDQWPASHREYPENLPNNMAVNKLMLPGFPFKSLYDWVKENGGTDCDDATGKATWHGYTAYFSKDQYQPYIQSLNSDELGIREYAKTFDGSDGDEDIFPTIEGTGFDIIQSAEKIDDNGIFAEGEDEPTVKLTLPSFGTGFDLKEQAGLGNSPAIVMKDGHCGGRSFSFEAANVTKNSNGTFTVKCKREHDDLLDLWFPYSYNKSKGQPSSADEPYQVCAGDNYVLTGIPMTDAYVEANAVKLLEASLLWLSKNDYSRHTYLPKVDEIYMARQHDEYLRKENARSLYLTIKEGDLLRFMDEDLHIGDSMIFIDSLTIKEYGNAQIPTYDITLRNDKEVGTIERMQEQINSLTAGSSSRSGGSGGGGMTANQINNIIEGTGEKLFLSKLKDDTAAGIITFLKGLRSKGDVVVNGLLTAYNAVMNTIRSSNYTGDGVADSGWSITNDYAGSSRLVVDYLYARKKAVFESLEVKELEFSSGDKAQSLASATLERTDYLEVDEQGNETLLGYSVQKIPWTLKGFMMRLSGIKPYALAGSKRIRITLKAEDLQYVNRIRCYFLAKDDDKKIYNLWKENDLARCQTFNIDNIDRETYAGDTHKEGNVYWWRLVKNISTETVTLDGKDYHYFDVAYGYTEEQEANSTGVRTSWCDLLSDLPAAGDKVVQFGNTSNPARMNIIVSEVNGEGNVDAPAIKSYRGVHTFNTDDDWWGGRSCRKMILSPSSGVEFYAPSFKFITEYGIERTQVERGAWLSIPFEEDKEHQTFPDYSDDILDENGNFVSRSDGSAKKYVRKCRYYDNVEHQGSSWRCTIAESHYWRYYDVKSKTWSKITDAQYKALSSDDKARCEEVRNYTTDEPSKASNDWTVSAERGADGSFKSRVFCRTNTNIKNANVSGGSYDNPIPTQTKIGDDVVQITWEDGVPQGTEILWSTVCTFYGDGSSSGWSKPAQETDTETLDIEYSPNAQQPANPTGTAADRNTSATIAAREQQGWYDPSRQPADQQMVWRAECKIKNGVYETKDGQPAWVVSRILGEKGERGPGGESIETISVYKAQSAKPDKPTGTTVPPSGWSLVPVEGSVSVDLTYSYTGNWTKSGNVLTSNAIDNNGITKERVSFTSTKSVKVKVRLTASSEYNYDFILIGNPDEDNVTRNSNYLQRVSGSGSVEVELDFSGAGSHFFVVAYAKDGSSTSGSDNGQFEILGAYESSSVPIWVSTGKLVNNVSDGVWSEPVRWNGKDGTNGVNGKDGWMITANPANVIITQSLDNSTSSFSSATVSFTAKKGNVSAVIASIGTPTSSQFNVSKSGNTVTVSSPKTHGSPAEYYTEGSFKVNVNVTDPDTGSTVTFSDFTVLCYANLLGTWKREVEAGVETVVAGLKQYLEDEDGNIITSESLRNDINDATQDLSTLSQTVTSQGQTIQSQNTRLSTAERNISTVTGKVNGLETSVSQISQTADEIKMSVNRGYRNYILNPKATDATTGVGSMSKVSDPVMGNVMNVYNSGNGDFQLLCKFDDDNRSDLTYYTVVTCYAVVKPKSSGARIINFGTWSANQQKPALVGANSTAEGVVSSVFSSEDGATTGMVSVGNGWYIIWSSFYARSVFSERKESVGINSVNGSRWLVYGYGIVVGNTCPTLEAILTNTGLRSAGIDIKDGTVNLMGDRVIFSNSTGTVSGKVWIDPDDGTIHATDGEFSGEITATGGSIGGFTIDTNRLYNSNWNAGIDITYDGKNVKIGKNAKGESFAEDAIIRAENTKTKSKTTNTYNTAMYLNASGARYNYAFYGNGNGVLNGLVFGFKSQIIQFSGSSDETEDMTLRDGSVFYIRCSYHDGNKRLRLPKLSEVRGCLGLKSTDTTPFGVCIDIVNESGHSNIYIGFAISTSEYNSGYPARMSDENTMYTGSGANWQIQSNQYKRVLLCFTSATYGYRGYVME